MPKFVIEKGIPKAGAASSEPFQSIAGQPGAVLEEMDPRIQWLYSYVVTDQTYYVCIAPDAEAIRQYAARGGFSANRISEVRSIMDSTTREG